MFAVCVRTYIHMYIEHINKYQTKQLKEKKIIMYMNREQIVFSAVNSSTKTVIFKYIINY